MLWTVEWLLLSWFNNMRKEIIKTVRLLVLCNKIKEWSKIGFVCNLSLESFSHEETWLRD